MDSFLRYVNSLPKDQKDIFYKYMGVISACQLDTEEKIAFLESNNIKIETAKALVRVFAMDVKDIKARFKLYKESGLEDLIISDPEILRYYPSKVISRVKACEKVGKAIYVHGKPATYLFDDVQWNALKDSVIADEQEFKGFIDDKSDEAKEVDPTTWLKEDDYISDDSYDFDVVAFERYERLSGILENINSFLGSSAINAESNLVSDEYLMKEIGTHPEKTDKEIIIGCLAQYIDITSDIYDTVDSFLPENGFKQGDMAFEDLGNPRV